MTAADEVSITLGDSKSNAGASSGGPYKSVLVTVQQGAAFNPMELASLPVTEKAVMTVTILPSGSGSAFDETAKVKTALLLAGFLANSEKMNDNGSLILTARRKQITSAMAVQLPKKQVVTISLNDDSDDMINEDDLLNDEEGALAPDMNGAPLQAAGDDCGGRAPCDDCTCGRADAENVATQQKQQQPVQSSACGKCGMGDAFRCASCPYLGKPAFKAGEEHLVLDLQDDF